jgi:hypothetical protein
MSYRDKARRALESSAARNVQNEYLKQIRNRHAALKDIEDVDALVALLRDTTAIMDRKDAILLALVKEHQREGGNAFALLAVAMFPALDRLYRTRLHRMPEYDDFWGRIVGAFAEALDRYPVKRRPARVAANIEGDTMASLRRAALRENRAALATEILADDARAIGPEVVFADIRGEPLVHLADFAKPGPERPVPPESEEMKAAEAALEPYFEASAISREDRFLIIGVHLYERTLGDLAKELGISREAAKKRHLRAMARLAKSRPRRSDDET